MNVNVKTSDLAMLRLCTISINEEDCVSQIINVRDIVNVNLYGQSHKKRFKFFLGVGIDGGYIFESKVSGCITMQSSNVYYICCQDADSIVRGLRQAIETGFGEIEQAVVRRIKVTD